MTGPIGTGKSALAAAVAERIGAAVVRLDCSDLAGRQNGSAIEAALSRVLASAARAGSQASGAGEACVLIIEDVDVAFASSVTIALGGADADSGLVPAFSAPMLVAALAEFFDSLSGGAGRASGATSASRSSTTGPFATASGFVNLQMAASPPRVFVLGTTSRPGAVDSRLRRVGRFEVEVALEAPTAVQRAEILRACLGQSCPGARVSDAELADVAGRANGYVGADLRAVCAEAAMAALRRRLLSASDGSSTDLAPSVGVEDLMAGLRTVQVRTECRVRWIYCCARARACSSPATCSQRRSGRFTLTFPTCAGTTSGGRRMPRRGCARRSSGHLRDQRRSSALASVRLEEFCFTDRPDAQVRAPCRPLY